MPPVFGAINARVIAKRPDLRSVKGHLVRVPRTFDIDIVSPHPRVFPFMASRAYFYTYIARAFLADLLCQ